MSELARIQDQLQRSFDGEAWAGPSVTALLADVSATQAAANPRPGIHSIWELVHHLITWQRIAVRRLAGETIVDVPEAVNWPPVADASEAAWRRTRDELASAHRQLSEAIGRLAEARLSETVPGTRHSIYVELHGLVQHNSYHTGQIALVKKLLR
jgi:uncharacterized damage-inducible protein DinB